MTDDVATDKLDTAFAALPAESHGFLVGFSGGLDSTVLLHRLATDPRITVRALHVHHGLHPEADRWAQHCQTFCAGLGVAVDVVRVQVTNDAGHGIEAAARQARYAAFAAALHDGECLVTAHHQDDQAETVLLRLLRGSGAGGLGAMRAIRMFARGRHWRPLLDTPRIALADYARQHRLQWIEDPSNVDARHDRNFLRHKLMPVLRQRWPHAGAALARSAMLLSEHEALLEQQTASRLAQVRGVDPNTLSVPALEQFDAPWRALIFRRWTTELNLPTLPAAGIESIEQTLLTARPDASAQFHWQGATIRRWRDLLYAETQSADLPSDWRADWDGAMPLPLPTGARLRLHHDGASADAASESERFRVRARRGGERIALPGRTHSHTLKNVLQELGIPPWQRKRLPLIFAPDGELLAVGDVLRSARAHLAGWRFRIEHISGDR